MKRETRRKVIMTSLVALALLVGLVGGYLVVHKTMPSMHAMKETSKDQGSSAMKDMPGMAGMSLPAAPPGAVMIPAVQRQLIGVRSTPVKYAPLGQEVRAVGTVTYDERKLTQVNLRVSGWIQKVFVDAVGGPVHKDEPLLTLYSPDLLATQDEYLLALRSQAQLTGSPMAEAKQGAAALVASARERLKLWNLTDQQIAELERRGKSEAVMTIYAPSSGIVLKREALPGKYVEPGMMLYEIADISTVWIYADVYDAQMASVKLNQAAGVQFDAYPGEAFKGKVAYLYPYVNEATRTMRVRLEMPNPRLKLKPGMYGTVLLTTDTKARLVVPKEAVLDTGVRQVIFLDKGEGVYVPTEVKIGRRSEETVEILEGVKEGDRVVTSATFLLDAESKLASTGNMQQMMGQIGMADWQMRGAYEAKMDDMKNMPGMGKGGVPAPPGREGAMSGQAKAVSETRKVSGYVLTLSTVPEIPKSGENLLRLKIADTAGKPVSNAQVVFIYTMPMPGMTDTKVPATYKEGIYEGKAMLGMSGAWDVTANITISGKPPISEKFILQVGGGM